MSDQEKVDVIRMFVWMFSLLLGTSIMVQVAILIALLGGNRG
jgi:multisubunit Na+/H+ antiporter MnhF subunit